jgi:hypothetical protein
MPGPGRPGCGRWAPRLWKSTPRTWEVRGAQPTPTPTTKRPLLSRSMVAMARANVTAAQTSGSGSSSVGQQATDDSPFWTHGRRLGAAVVGLATLVGTGAALWPLLGK